MIAWARKHENTIFWALLGACLIAQLVVIVVSAQHDKRRRCTPSTPLMLLPLGNTLVLLPGQPGRCPPPPASAGRTDR